MTCNVVGKDDMVEDMMADRMKVDIEVDNAVDNKVDNAVDNKVVVVHLVVNETVQDNEIIKWMVEEDDGNSVVVALNAVVTTGEAVGTAGVGGST